MNIFVIVFVVIPIIGYLVLRSPTVQTYLTSLATNYLQKELKTEIRIGGVNLSLGLDLILEDVFIADRHKDTLLFTTSLQADISKLDRNKQILDFSRINLKNAVVKMVRHKEDSCFNYQFIVDYFSPSDTTDTVAAKPWKISIKDISLQNAHFNYKIEREAPLYSGMDYDNLDCKKINLRLKNIHFKGDTIYANINQLAASEKCGFNIRHLSADATIAPDRWQLENFRLETDFSDISMKNLVFRFDSISDFSEFIDKVKLSADIGTSTLHSADLVHFAPELSGMNERLRFKGNFKGTIAHLRVTDFDFKYGYNTSFKGDIRLSGLPNIEETFIQLYINEFITNTLDINNLHLPGGSTIEIPSQMEKLGDIAIKGKFTGFYNDFVSDGDFTTDIGFVRTDLSLKNNISTRKISYEGKLVTRGFELGQLLKIPANVGKLNMNSQIRGSGFTLDDLDIQINAIIDSLDVQGNVFRMIIVDGEFINKNFNGSMSLRDETIDIDLEGNADFAGTAPAFNLSSSIRHADLNRLKLVKSDSAYKLSTNLVIQMKGTNPEIMSGSVLADSTYLFKNSTSYNMKQFRLDLKPAGEMKHIDILSDFLDININAAIKFKEAPYIFTKIAEQYLPSLKFNIDSVPLSPGDKSMEFGISLKNTDKLTKVFAPGLLLGKGSIITGKLLNTDKSVEITGTLPGIVLNGILLKTLDFNIKSSDGQLQLHSSLKHMMFNDSIGLDSLIMTAGIGHDSIRFNLDWNNQEKVLKNTGDIQGLLSLSDYPLTKLKILNSEAYINDSLWKIQGTNDIIINKDIIQVHNLSFIGSGEVINLNGLISDNPLDHMILDIQNFNLNNIDLLTKSIDFDFDGVLNGRIDVSNLYQSPNFVSSINIKNLAVNKDKLGNAEIMTVWDPATLALSTKAEVIYRGNIGENKPISIQGFYFPDKKDSSLAFDINVNNFKLKTISNFLSSFSSKFTGLASGNIKLLGSPKTPSLVGTLKVNRGEIKIDYLNVVYSFSHDIRFSNNLISIDDMIIYDSIGNKSSCNADIRHNYFNDFQLNINLQPNQLLSMNTDFTQNELFYGKGFSTGKVSIHGPVDNLNMDITATTNKGTEFFLPINTSAGLGNNDFITFIQPVKEDTVPLIPQEYQADLSGININFDLRATEDAFVKIFMPGDLGNISATGEGNLRMNVNTRGEFNIYGDYEFRNGDFIFTLQKVIQRHFKIQQGGKISFTGSPYETKVDLSAVYKIDVPLKGLNLQSYQSNISGGSDVSGKKVPVNCIIDLKGNLFNPEILFKIRLEDNNTEINRVVFTQIDTNNQQQMAEQMIFLLVLRQFKPLDRGNSINIGNSVGTSSWEMVSNQLSGWLSQISKDFDVGVNYRPGENNLSSDEISVALSTQLFNDRLSIDGNFGVLGNTPSGASNQNASNIVGDVNVEFKLTPDGRFRVKAYNKSNNSMLFENNAPYTQGVGLFYRKEFDYFRDLFQRKPKGKVQ